MSQTTKAKQQEEESAQGGLELSLEDALKVIKDFHLVYDTNILDKLCCDNAKHRNAVVLISAQNTTVICDTVFWEFLRNCNLDKFIKRRKQLEENGHSIIEHEDQKVRDMFVPMWMTYLAALKDDPKRMARIKIPDLHIATFCVAKKYDHILTLDNSGDFPPELFDDQEFLIDGNKFRLHLKTFKREVASQLWVEAMNGDISVSFQEWR